MLEIQLILFCKQRISWKYSLFISRHVQVSPAAFNPTPCRPEHERAAKSIYPNLLGLETHSISITVKSLLGKNQFQRPVENKGHAGSWGRPPTDTLATVELFQARTTCKSWGTKPACNVAVRPASRIPGTATLAWEGEDGTRKLQDDHAGKHPRAPWASHK